MDRFYRFHALLEIFVQIARRILLCALVVAFALQTHLLQFRVHRELTVSMVQNFLWFAQLAHFVNHDLVFPRYVLLVHMQT